MNQNTTDIPNTLLEGLREVFIDSFQEETEPMQATSKDIFNFYNSNKNSEDFQKASGVGRFTAVAEEDPTPIVKRDEIMKTNFKPDLYRRGVGISYEAMQDQLYSEMKDDTEQLGLSARETQEFNRFAVIRNITTTVGADGVALASNSHPLSGGEVLDNLLTGTVSETKLKEMFQMFRESKDYTLKQYTAMPRLLLTAPANHPAVMEYTKSKLQAGTGNNNLNYFSELFPGVQVKFSPYNGAAQGGSDTGVTLIGKRHKLNVVLREKINTWMQEWKANEDIVTKFMAKYREAVGFADFIGIVHLTGV